ncbi:hypothetical protein J2X02_000549 [Pseudoxanthomonas japonensis]|uniref:hypothetical protein n=1 Tax=Pseudoxanthomonas japonensis TaxID=69284 RepID=UPI00285FB7E2|nr:hypothetical protein [Pseudoxanthomonas japonensis]MDR7067732.1 hypothetical protein [Pseudoxanthomonas japonensis]
MSPRIEFVLLSSLLASALATVGYLCLFRDADSGQSGDGSLFALSTVLSATVSAAVGAFYAAAVHSRTRPSRGAWTPARLNLHAVLATLAIYPLVVGSVWAVCELASERHVPSMTDVGYVMMIGIFVGFYAVAAGAIPTFILEYFACSRYLRRTAATRGPA